MENELYFPENKSVPYDHVMDMDKDYDSVCSTCQNRCNYNLVVKKVSKIGVIRKEKLLDRSGILFAITECDGHLD